MPVHLWAILHSYVLTLIPGFDSGKPILETSSVNLSVFIDRLHIHPYNHQNIKINIASKLSEIVSK